MATQCHSCDTTLTNDEASSGYCPFCGKAVERQLSGDAIACPCCSQDSDSIKCFSMGVLVFLFIAWMWWPKNEIGCPACIRGKIATFILVNFITANILWPFFIVPLSLILLLRSFQKGHSWGVTNLLR